ncbi:MAG: DUF4832 domain-containing protein [Balneolales bacterium]
MRKLNTFPSCCRRFGLVFALPVCLLFLLQCDASRDADSVSVNYEPTDEIINNPERGFYRFTRGGLGDDGALDVDFLREIRNDGFTLISRGYYLEPYRESDIPEELLNRMDEDFQVMREGGVKAFVRFSYSRRIGDPDASLERVHRHMDQLAPVFERNYDVIVALAGGFIGAWGEWHNSTNNLETPENMRAVLFKLLEVLPEERMVALRSPRHKMNIYQTNQPFSEEQAFNGSNISRTGHHNDCFLASDTDVGTYVLGRYPRFDLEDSLTVDGIKNYIAQETRFTPMGGETCNPRPDAGDRFHCPTALEEMDWMNWTFLNWNYSRQILDTWEDQGCMPEVQRRLGYRFAMLDGSFSQAAAPGGTFHFNLNMVNEGFASPFNARDLQVVLRSVDNPNQVWKVDLPDDPRYWLSGESIQLRHELGVPEGLADGEYEVLLNLPDPTETLRNHPAFSIRLANAGTWEEATGFNRLNHRLIINSSAGSQTYRGDLTFEPFGA